MLKFLAVPIVAAMLGFGSGQALAFPTQNTGLAQQNFSNVTTTLAASVALGGQRYYGGQRHYGGHRRIIRRRDMVDIGTATTETGTVATETGTVITAAGIAIAITAPTTIQVSGDPDTAAVALAMVVLVTGALATCHTIAFAATTPTAAATTMTTTRGESASPTGGMSSGARRDTRPTIPRPTHSSARAKRSIVATAPTTDAANQRQFSQSSRRLV